MIVGGIMNRTIMLVTLWVSLVVCALRAAPAAAECNCLAVAGEVSAEVRDVVARADSLYARGDYAAALALYAEAHASSGDAILLYAQGMAHWQLGQADEARARLEAFAALGGDDQLEERAAAAVGAIDSGVQKAVHVGGVVAGGVGGLVGAGASGAVDLGGDVVGGVTTRLDRPKPKRLAKGAAIFLGVVAVGAVAVVGYNSIHARRYESVEFDGSSNLGLGVAGVAIGGTAVYLWGLTAATGATAGTCLTEAPAPKRPRRVVAPFAARGGGGLAAALTF
jgi:hypothetical protein